MVIELHEADASLDQASCLETLSAEHFRLRLIESIHLGGRGSLTGEVERFGGFGLHPKHEFKGFDAGTESIVVRAWLEVQSVQASERVEFAPLAPARRKIA